MIIEYVVISPFIIIVELPAFTNERRGTEPLNYLLSTPVQFNYNQLYFICNSYFKNVDSKLSFYSYV